VLVLPDVLLLFSSVLNEPFDRRRMLRSLKKDGITAGAGRGGVPWPSSAQERISQRIGRSKAIAPTIFASKQSKSQCYCEWCVGVEMSSSE